MSRNLEAKRLNGDAAGLLMEVAEVEAPNIALAAAVLYALG